MPFEPNNSLWKLAKRPRRPLAWEFEGSCIRCTSHAPNSKGYIWFGHQRKSRQTIAREILRRRLGHAPELACHTCDNRWCINPDHIYNGSYADNVRDRESRGRGVRNPPFGVVHWNAKLTEAQVIEIRNSPLRQVELAALYGVAQQTISRIKNYKRRKRG